MQLYIQAMQIKWSYSHIFQNLILRPRVMHIVQNVCRFLSHLMQGSRLDTLIGAAFGGVSSIMGHGKPWVRALRVFRMVSSILRQSFPQIGFEAWEEICEYLERAQLHPTGRQWVYNLITPTLLAHQLIRSEREREIIGFYCSSATSGYYLTFSSLDTTTMQGTCRGTASRCQYSCLPRPRTTFSLVHLSADTKQAAGTLSLPISSGSRRQ